MKEEVKIPYIQDIDIPAKRGSSIGTRGITAFNQLKHWKAGSGNRSIRSNTEKGFWIGSEDFENAPFSVDMDGKVTASNYQFCQQYTAGEDISAGKLCCIKGTVETYCNHSDADHNTAIVSADTYVYEASPDSNYGNDTLLLVGDDGGYSYRIYMKIDTSKGIDWYKTQKVLLKLKLIFNELTSNPPAIEVHRVTADWSESTITWNNQPSYDTFVWAKLNLTTSSSTGVYYDIDITELYKMWDRGSADGGFNNYGIVLLISGLPYGKLQFGSKERTGGGEYDQKPYVEITSEFDSDGKAYLASNNDYNKVKNIIGIALEDKSAGETIKIMSLTDGSEVDGNYTKGRIYYLADDEGTLNYYLTPKPSDKWAVKVGVGKGSKLLIQTDKMPKFIRSFTYDDFENNSSVTIVAPTQASMLVVTYEIKIDFTTVDPWTKGQLILYRDRITDVTNYDTENAYSDEVYVSVRAQWDTNAPGNGNVTISASSNKTILEGSATIYFYE